MCPQGFLSAEMDQFAQDVVFPAFTPTLGLFLAISTGYGVLKVGGVDGWAVQHTFLLLHAAK